MKVQIFTEENKPLNEIDIISHPQNQPFISDLTKSLTSTRIQVKNPKNQREVSLVLSEIESAEAFGHLTKIYRLDQAEFYYNQRIKSLSAWQAEDFFQINKSTILNLRQVASFAVSEQARLTVFTKSGQEYTVTRYYAKQLKERLRCINN